MHWFWDSVTGLLSGGVLIWCVCLVGLSFYPLHPLTEEDLDLIEEKAGIIFYEQKDEGAQYRPPGFGNPRITTYHGGDIYLDGQPDQADAIRTYGRNRGVVTEGERNRTLYFKFYTSEGTRVNMRIRKNQSVPVEAVEQVGLAQNTTMRVGQLVDRYKELHRYELVDDLISWGKNQL